MTRLRIALIGVGALLLQTLALDPVGAQGTPVTLQADPETGHNTRGPMDFHNITLTIPPGTTGGAYIRYKILSGPSAVSGDRAENVKNMAQHDGFCAIPPGETSCSLRFEPPRTDGTDVIMFWVDTDSDNNTVEADKAEAADAGGDDEPVCPGANCSDVDLGTPGDTAEPDGTDVVTKTWGQLGAQRPPFIDGTTERLAKQCDTQRTRDSVEKQCVFSYLLASESVENTDYGAVWLQTTVDPRRGWCVRRADAGLGAPDDGAVEEVVVPIPGDYASRTLMTSELIFGPQTGQGPAAYLQQTYFAYPGTISTETNGDITSTVWRGKTRRTVASVVGMEVTWDPATFPQFPGSVLTGHRERRC